MLEVSFSIQLNQPRWAERGWFNGTQHFHFRNENSSTPEPNAVSLKTPSQNVRFSDENQGLNLESGLTFQVAPLCKLEYLCLRQRKIYIRPRPTRTTNGALEQEPATAGRHTQSSLKENAHLPAKLQPRNMILRKEQKGKVCGA